jgi:N-dimethylarginine dimethylaminohydrolase
MREFGGHTMVAPLRRVAVKRPEEAFRSREAIQTEWPSLGFLRAPDLDRASREHRAFMSLVTKLGAEALELPSDGRTNLDSLYAHDPVLITDAGVIVCQPGKVLRRGEGPAFADALGKWEIPILGVIDGAATAEGGDLLWLDQRTLIAGRGFRTNAAGIDALRRLLGPLGVTVVEAPLPYWQGPGDVLHLMSLVSLLDDNLAVVYRKLLPVPLFELFAERGIEMIDVPEEEYDTLGCNVLAIAPRMLVMVAGNPVTRSRLEAAGCVVNEFEGKEICLPGSGGPTCLTGPLLRSA